MTFIAVQQFNLQTVRFFMSNYYSFLLNTFPVHTHLYMYTQILSRMERWQRKFKYLLNVTIRRIITDNDNNVTIKHGVYFASAQILKVVRR